MIGLRLLLPRRMNQRPTVGMNTIENRNEMSSVMMTVVGIGRMNSPRIPPTKSIGEKTTTVVSVPANEALPTRSIARLITPSESSCASRFASIDSEITIASSTSSPSVRISPNSVIVFSVKPNANRPVNAPSTTRPMNPAVMTATRQPMSRRLTKATASSPVSRLPERDESWRSTPVAKSAVMTAAYPSESGLATSWPSTNSLNSSTSWSAESARISPIEMASW